MLAPGYLPPAELATLFAPGRPAAAAPLRRRRPGWRPVPLAHREQRAKALGQSLRAALPAGAAMPDLPALRRALPPETASRRWPRRLGVHGAARRRGPARRPGRRRATRLVVPLAAIRQFLEDPLQGSARFRLRLREVEGDEELLDREDEAFETDRPLRAGLLREAMPRRAGRRASRRLGRGSRALLDAAGAAGGAARAGAHRVFRGGRAPGAGGASCAAGSRSWRAGRAASRSAGGCIRFGRRRRARARCPAVAPRSHPARRCPAEIPGASRARSRSSSSGAPSCWSAPARGLRLGAPLLPQPLAATTRPAGSATGCARFVDHLALSAAGLSPGPARRRWWSWAGGGEHEPAPARFRPLRRRGGPRLPGGAGDRHADRGPRRRRRSPPACTPTCCPARRCSTPANGAGHLVEEIERLRDNYLEKPVAPDVQLGQRPGARGGRAPRSARRPSEAERMAADALRPVLRSAGGERRRMSAPCVVALPQPGRSWRQLGARHAVVEASAGHRQDLHARAPGGGSAADAARSTLEQILVVTFTEKATAELVDRVRRKLEELAALTGRSPATPRAPPTRTAGSSTTAPAGGCASALLAFDRASISTIHGFCQRLLREHAFFNRRLFDEEVVDEEEAFEAAFAETLRRDRGRRPGRWRAGCCRSGWASGGDLGKAAAGGADAPPQAGRQQPARPAGAAPGRSTSCGVLAAARGADCRARRTMRQGGAQGRRRSTRITAKRCASGRLSDAGGRAARAAVAARDLLAIAAGAIDASRDGAPRSSSGKLEQELRGRSRARPTLRRCAARSTP